MDVRQAPALALERVRDLRSRPGQQVPPIVIAQNHPEIEAVKVGVGLFKVLLEGGIVHRGHPMGINVIA
jgi:hypothetical protein